MEANFIKQINKNARKESTASSISTQSSGSSNEEINDNSQKTKDFDDFEMFLNQIEEVEKTDKTFTHKIRDMFESKEEDNPLILDENRTIEEIIESKGFQCQKHTVKTEDGYVLVLFRILGAKNEEEGSKLPPALLQHGIFDSSDGWVCNGEDHSIPFVLARNNFDVWLSNSRGNKYCKEHDRYQPTSYEFWQFSFNELGRYDIPAVIKYIREVNKSGEKIIYFGHSQGATLMFSGLADNFDFYKNNLKLFVALAPVTKISNLGSTLLSVMTNISVHKIMEKADVCEVCPYSEGMSSFANFMNKNATTLTNYFIGLISDSDSKECNNQNSLSVYLKHYPCGTSLKCLLHYIQIMESKKFAHFDYERGANIQIYHQIEPPEYDLKTIQNFPIMLITGDKDRLATPDDVRWLYNELKSNVIYFHIASNMGHLSFLIGNDFSWFDEPLEIILEEYYMK